MNKSNSPSQKVTKKEARLLVYTKLAEALAEYKNGKKFETKLKKASKLIVPVVVKASQKANGSSRKINKKITKTKPEAKKTQEALS